jgi:hypothetical protein
MTNNHCVIAQMRWAAEEITVLILCVSATLSE